MENPLKREKFFEDLKSWMGDYQEHLSFLSDFEEKNISQNFGKNDFVDEFHSENFTH